MRLKLADRRGRMNARTAVTLDGDRCSPDGDRFLNRLYFL